MSIIKKIDNIRKEKGYLKLFKMAFFKMAPKKKLKGLVRYNDVYIQLEKKVPFYNISERLEDKPHLEEGIAGAHKRLTNSGDRVVIVGGGKGVTAVIASNLVGEDGSVIVYEGGDKGLEIIKNTIKINNVDKICKAKHAVVGNEVDVYGGDTTFAERIKPEDLNDCEVLELDCEGSEINIINDMIIDPRVIIVELHPNLFPEPPEYIISLLENKGYKIVWKSGHDGVELNDRDFKELLYRSAEIPGDKKQKKEYAKHYKYLSGGARWPVVIAAEKKSYHTPRDD